MIAHSEEPWKFHEQGEANEFCLVTSAGKWVVAFRQNGEMMPDQQRENARRIVACINACSGFSTEALEAQVLAGRGIIRAFQDQRDDLIAALKEIQAAGGYPERVYELTKAAIAKAQGGE